MSAVNNAMHYYYSANTLFFIPDLAGNYDISASASAFPLLTHPTLSRCTAAEPHVE